jgi:hypothetical protein
VRIPKILGSLIRLLVLLLAFLIQNDSPAIAFNLIKGEGLAKLGLYQEAIRDTPALNRPWPPSEDVVCEISQASQDQTPDEEKSRQQRQFRKIFSKFQSSSNQLAKKEIFWPADLLRDFCSIGKETTLEIIRDIKGCQKFLESLGMTSSRFQNRRS